MEFKEVYEDAKSGKFIRPSVGTKWLTINNMGNFEGEKGGEIFIPISWYTLTTWEIKPEHSFLWGVREKDGADMISDAIFIQEGDEWKMNPNAAWLEYSPNSGPFPKDKPQKYELVPVED